MSAVTPAEILDSLFGRSHRVESGAGGLLHGEGLLAHAAGPATRVSLIGLTQGAALGVDGALALAQRVLSVVQAGERNPILVLIDSGSQRMSRRDELLGLNEYLGHLAKTLMLAEQLGHPTIGLLYGGSAAGAFIATALATRVLVALPEARPAVMDLPSMSRITKLSLELLRDMASSTPVFAPGLANMELMGAVTERWDPGRPLDAQLRRLLDRFAERSQERRDQRAAARGGRLKAAAIAERVEREALRDG